MPASARDTEIEIKGDMFREYDFWWGISITGCLGGKGVNYLKAENKREIALVQLPIILLTLALFLALTLLRVFQPSRNAFVQGEVQVLAYASFYFSVTDVGLGLIEAFPSPALCVRRWNIIWVFAALWLSWLALILVTFLVPIAKQSLLLVRCEEG